MSHIKASCDHLYDAVPSDGVYMVEDLCTAYWEVYEGDLRKEGTFIECCKELIDHFNASYTRGELLENEFSKTTPSMHVYDGVIAFDKGPPFPAGFQDGKTAVNPYLKDRE